MYNIECDGLQSYNADQNIIIQYILSTFTCNYMYYIGEDLEFFFAKLCH